MSENKHEQHHHFHHHKSQNTDSEATPYEKAMKEEKHHKRMEHLGELGAVAGGTFALVLYIFLSYSLILNLGVTWSILKFWRYESFCKIRIPVICKSR